MAIQNTTVEGVELTNCRTVAQLLARRKLYDMKAAAKILGKNFRYLRRLCRARKVDHHRILGRYYMTPQEVAECCVPVRKIER